MAKARIRRILERETVAHQKTLEQKISDQGPPAMRVDPHLVGLALMDLVQLQILAEHNSYGVANWFAHRLEQPNKVNEKLEKAAPLYAATSKGHFPNLVGDALEVITYKSIKMAKAKNSALSFFGSFKLDKPKDKTGRYVKLQPPKHLGDNETQKEADFLVLGYADTPIVVECKNVREWLYPNSTLIKELIIKSYELGGAPLMVHRRMHYSTTTNLLVPGGIMAHQSLFQYYPEDKAEEAKQVSHKRMLGFTDVRASEDPHPRTVNFFENILPKIAPGMAARWETNKEMLYRFAHDDINIAQLYTAIGSPAGGKWVEHEPGDHDGYQGYDED